MNPEKLISNRFVYRLKAYRKTVLLIFELFWIVVFLWCYPYPFISAEKIDIAPNPQFALIFSTVVSLVISASYLLIIEKIDLLLHKGGKIDDSIDIVFFISSYLLAVFITYCLSFASVKLFRIQNIIWLKTLLQVLLFLLSIVLFCAYRRYDKRQYGFYAAIYFFSTIAEWHWNWIVQDCPEIDSILDSIIPFFVIPSKEAMLLFIILDEYLKKPQKSGEEALRSMENPFIVDAQITGSKNEKRGFAMQKRRLADLLLILIGGAIALISYFYLEEDVRWWLIVLGCAMILIFLILAIRERHWVPLQAGASLLDMPPTAKVTEVLLLNEEDQTLATWPLYGKVSMIIGRDVGENRVDINLMPSTYASTVDVEHAVLNYTGGSWYVEDLGSKNGVSVQSSKDGRKYKLASDQPCKLNADDIIYIGLARLLIR